MNVKFSPLAKQQLFAIKRYIAKDSPKNAKHYLEKIKAKIENIAKFPYIGKVNATYSVDTIREFAIFGYKVIYEVEAKQINILAIYKHIDFDERNI
jgi:plasmid stabilization system protein ParE